MYDCLGKRLLSLYNICFNHGMHEYAGLVLNTETRPQYSNQFCKCPSLTLILIPPEMSVCLKSQTLFVFFYLPLYHPIKSVLNLIFPSPVFKFQWRSAIVIFCFLCWLCCSAGWPTRCNVWHCNKWRRSLWGQSETAKERQAVLLACSHKKLIKHWPIRAWLWLFVNAHPTQSDAYIILLMTGS